MNDAEKSNSAMNLISRKRMKEAAELQETISRKARVSCGYFFEGNKADRREPSLQKTYPDDTELPHKRPRSPTRKDLTGNTKTQSQNRPNRKHKDPKPEQT